MTVSSVFASCLSVSSFTGKVMDLRTAVTIAALFLITADVCLTLSNGTTLQPNSSVSTPVSSGPCSCPDAVTTPTPTSKLRAPDLGFLSIEWNKCEGEVFLHNSSGSSPVCFGSLKDLLQNVCKYKRGCKDTPHWKATRKELSCSNITETGAKQTSGKTLRVQCTEDGGSSHENISDVKKQLWTYKVMTALLCCVLVIILLIRFTKPTVKALQRRLSDKRQNRWIGPTQSHSVSYQRGKTVKNDEGEKRLSYPALERLTVSDSREPSSNRNSGYNF